MIKAQSKNIPVASVVVSREARQRQGDLDTASLQESIKRNGLINPIVVTKEGVLVAGERRLSACIALGWTQVPARTTDTLDPVDLQILELEENIKRKDLEWQDLVRGVGTIHDLYRSKDPDWTMTETAVECGITQPTVSMYLRVREELKDQRIAEAGTVREAYNITARRDQRKQGDSLAELLGEPAGPAATSTPAPDHKVEVMLSHDPAKPDSTPVPTFTKVNVKTGERQIITEAEAKKLEAAPEPSGPFSGILNESFLSWAPAYTGLKFNLLHCDFPYGVNLFDGPQGRGAEPSAGYSDTEGVYDALIECLCANLDRVMTLSGHMMFWLSADYKIIGETIAKFNRLAPSLHFHKFPLIWHKTDNAGIASDPTHGPRHVYEACLLASRSRRQIVRVVGDTYGSGTDKRLHPSTKPEPMLKHFLTMLVDENTSMLDPTCGSGASLRAAESLGARHTLGLEIDPDFAQAAQAELKRSRVLLAAAKLAKQQGAAKP